MRNFEFLEPHTVEEASALLRECGEEARPIAGGTALVLLLRQRIFHPTHLIGLGGIPGLAGIAEADGGGLRIGALVRHCELEEHPLVRDHFPILAEMARTLANPQIRNMGTVVGNLCHGDPASDPPPALMALGTSVRAVSGEGARSIPLTEFFTGYYENVLRRDEIVTDLLVPPLPPRAGTAYLRQTGNALEDRPIAAVGVLVVPGDGRRCKEARICVGAAEAVPTRAQAAEAALRGAAAGERAWAEAAGLAMEAVDPISDFRGSAEYRREVVRVLVCRALAMAWARAQGRQG